MIGYGSFDRGDCNELNLAYPNCNVTFPSAIGNGICDGGLYNTKDCGYDEGDCDSFNKQYTDCYGVELVELGDGICQHNTEGCNFVQLSSQIRANLTESTMRLLRPVWVWVQSIRVM